MRILFLNNWNIMTQFKPNSPKNMILGHLDGVSKKVRASMDEALSETRKLHHAHGLPLEPGKAYDRQYFAYTMRMIAKRNLADCGVEAEIENEVPDFKIESVSLGGLILRKPGFVIRILRPDANLDLPRAASESRAQFYEQKQTSFAFAEEELSSEELNIVYLWDVNHDFTKLSWQIALPKDRFGACHWKVTLDEAADASGAPAKGGDSTPPSRPPLAAVAELANSDLNYTPKTAVKKEKTEARRSKDASGGA
jgi:hypothetical protein